MNSNLERLFVMRHAESLEDIDNTAYERIADEDMPLSEQGKRQAAEFGSDFVSNFSACCRLKIILSPSKRVLRTAEILVSKLPSNIGWSLTTDHLIVKQNWGNVTIHNRTEVEKERYRIGVLRYRFPGGENGAEMLSRFGVFVERLQTQIATCSSETTLVITHGFEMRVLLKSLLGWSEEYFESLAHPRHCEVKRLALCEGGFVLLDEMRKHDLSGAPGFIKRQ